MLLLIILKRGFFRSMGDRWRMRDAVPFYTERQRPIRAERGWSRSALQEVTWIPAQRGDGRAGRAPSRGWPVQSLLSSNFSLA